jgi:hypothetical protein
VKKQRPPVLLPSELIARGAAAERDFQAWLDASTLPYIYANQSQETVPEPYRASLKRPDYIVSLPYIGAMAFDVKSKSLYEEAFIFDASEVDRLATFDQLFRITTFFACLDPEGSPVSVWFRVSDLATYEITRRGGKRVLIVPFAHGLVVDMRSPFQEAFGRVISLQRPK